MKKGKIKISMDEEVENRTKNDLKGYPVYPSEEDIYSKDKEEREIDPEDTTEETEYPETDKLSEKHSEINESDNDLDIPGSELDDDLENIGSEDEENNYYSLGDEYFENQEDINEK